VLIFDLSFSLSLSFVDDFFTVLVVVDFVVLDVLSGDTERVGLAFLSVDVVEGLSLGTVLRSRPTLLLSLVLVESLLSTLSLLLELSLLDFLGTSLVVAVVEAVLVFLAGDVDLARALVSAEAVVVVGTRLGTADFEVAVDVVEEVIDMIVEKGYRSRGMRRSIMGRGFGFGPDDLLNPALQYRRDIRRDDEDGIAKSAMAVLCEIRLSLTVRRTARSPTTTVMARTWSRC